MLYTVTYDITWIAYYGWVWTTLEAQLAVICASAPSLKVFFSRYFSQYTTRTAYSISASRGKTPDLSSKLRSKTMQSSTQRSQIRAGDLPEGDIPMDGIKINYKLDVRYDESDDASQKSYTSTKGLTSLPPQEPQTWRDREEWAETCRAVCAGTRARRDDIEAGQAV